MSAQRQLEPLTRGQRRAAGAWADVQAPHPGVHAPRNSRVDDWPPMVNAAIIATCAFLTAVAILSASLASPVGRVERWASWATEAGDMHLEHPAGWAVNSFGSAEQIHLVIMRSPWVRIHIISESGLAEVAELYGRLGSGDRGYRTLEMLHRTTGDTWAGLFGELDEGAIGRTTIGSRHAVWSQFTYASGPIERGEPMTGYRATILSQRRGLIASAVAPSEHWEQFRPIALRVLRSISFDERGG
ncbi:MAG: hypothetical protein ACOX9R_02195 [Armatimonadota bacterium]|jgi:hypothetical protein